MKWTALVPLKRAGERKTRLGTRLSAGQRERLAERMFEHVLAVVGSVGAVETLAVLSDLRPAASHDVWLVDRGRGLNQELRDARSSLGAGPLLLILADLPALCPGDVSALLDAAGQAGCAIAPDRHRRGTNAVALADGRRFAFRFGGDSFTRHCLQAGGNCAIVERFGLALDVDTPDDLDVARASSAAGTAWAKMAVASQGRARHKAPAGREVRLQEDGK